MNSVAFATLNFQVGTPSQLLINGVPLSDFVTLAALLIAAYAAYQAFRTSRATSEAAIHAVLPLLLIAFDKDANGNTTIVLDNKGRGHAFNIELDGYATYVKGICVKWELRLRAIPDNLEEKRSMPLKITKYENDQEISEGGDLLIGFLQRGSRQVKLPIRYRDIIGRRYFTIVAAGQGYARIVRPSTRLTGFRAATFYGRYVVMNALLGHYYGWQMNRDRKRRSRSAQ